MSLTPGSRLGPYEVTALLGEGGMGEVYRAHDARLGRDVAIKVLHADVSTDAERLRRFEQEARAVASLNHPNILAVYDIGHADPAGGSAHATGPYIVSELLHGETLRSRLVAGPLTPRKAVEYAAQIARGLAAAHEKQLVHRDLKPDNVFITADDRVKILDFGLAKLTEKAGAAAGIAAATTAGHAEVLTIAPATTPGMVLGTVGYMAPEQVRGLAVDHRADIFALGAVLYEMLAGRRAFAGDTSADVLTAILREEPPELPADVRQSAPALARIVDRCVAKTPSARFMSAGDLAFALEALSSSTISAASVPTAAVESGSKPARPWLVAAAFAVGAALTAGVLVPLLRPPKTVTEEKPVVRLQLTLPDDVTPVRGQPPAVSPDGTRIAMVGIDQASGKRLVYIRPLNSLSAQGVRGTERAVYPFWSADGSKLGFFADGRLKTVDLSTGTLQDVAAASNVGGAGVWVDDTIVFPPNAGPLRRASASGGMTVPAVPFDATKEISQSVAGFLADRRRFVFGTNTFGTSPARIGSTDGSLSQPLTAASVKGVVHAPWLRPGGMSQQGHLLFVREATLFAVSLDGQTAQTVGEPQPLAQSVSAIAGGGSPSFSVQDDVLSYVSSANGASRLVWVNRQGQILNTAGLVSGFLRDVRISPDGSRVAVSRFNEANRVYDLMLVDLGRQTTSQLTYGSTALQASWSHDQSAIVFASASEKGSRLVQVAPTEGSAQTVVVPAGADVMLQPDIAPDGKNILYHRIRPDGNIDVALHSPADSTEERSVLASPTNESSARFSPDGAWFAYQSNESGSPEVYIRSFPAGDNKQQVSRGGANRPVWRSDGREIFYISPDGDLMAASITLTPTLNVGTPQKLFRTSIDPGGFVTYGQFDVAPDGQRFLMVVPSTDAPQPVNVILNWQSLLKP